MTLLAVTVRAWDSSHGSLALSCSHPLSPPPASDKGSLGMQDVLYRTAEEHGLGSYA
jgi:hypothetical protein